MKKTKAAPVGIHVGHNKESATEITKAILSVLNAPHTDESTKKEALRVLSKVFVISNVSIANCTINMEKDD
jgi:hypothetical protein